MNRPTLKRSNARCHSPSDTPVAGQFIVPKDPSLVWSMLAPGSRTRSTPRPVNGARTHYCFWARNAIYHGLKALGISPHENVLVPSFHCATAIEPILQSGAKVKFYNIHRDCSPDFGDIQAKIDDNTRAVLAIHYFGFPQPMKTFQNLCQRHRLYLIEDCAHVLRGRTEDGELGTFGDITVFSWRKFLPVYDGGQLVINNPKLEAHILWEGNNLLLGLKTTKNLLEKLIDDCSNGSIKKISGLFQAPGALARYFLSRRRYVPTALSINTDSLEFDLSSVNLRMSSLSRYILRKIDIRAIVEKRRVNYMRLLDALRSIAGLTPFFPDLPDGVCPWVFPVLANRRRDFHLDLRSKGIPAVTWGGVVHPELKIEAFPDAAFLYQNLILLPVHQSLGETELRTIVDVVAEVGAA